jgi:hypothetical protein
MAEYAGYIGNQYPPTDWSKIGANLLGQIDQEKERRKLEKEKIDNDYADSFAKIGDYEQTTDQDVNEFVYKGVDEVRNGIKTQYDLLKQGAITMSDYKLYKTTAMADWTNLNKAVKNFGQVNAGNQKLITEGKMSGLGQYNALNFAKLGDLKTAKIMINPSTGRLYRTNIDPKTGKIASQNDVYSPTAMLNPANLVDLKVNIDDQVSSFVKRLGEVGVVTDLGNGKIKLIESAQNNPAYKEALQAQVNALTATPRSTTSILTDYVGGYKFFESEAQKKELIASGTPASKLISVQRKNGVAEPVLTNAQEAEAQAFVENQIEAGVGTKTQQTQGFATQRALRPERISAADKKAEKTLQKNVTKAIIANEFMDPTGGSRRFGEIKNAALQMGIRNPIIVERQDGTKVLKGIPKGKKASEEIQQFVSPNQVYAFLEGKDNVLASSADYEEAVDYANEQGVDVRPGPKEEVIFNMKVAQKLDPNSTIEEIKQKIINDPKYKGKRLLWQ